MDERDKKIPDALYKWWYKRDKRDDIEQALNIKFLEKSIWRLSNDWWITTLIALLGAAIGALITMGVTVYLTKEHPSPQKEEILKEAPDRHNSNS